MVPLNIRSHYSFLRALEKIPPLVEYAKKHNSPSLALVDENNLYGALNFYQEAKREGIEPIIGSTLFLNNKIFQHIPRVLVYAKNNEGYRHIMRLISDAHNQKEYPHTTLEKIAENNKDIYTVIPPLCNSLSRDTNTIKKELEYYKKLFGDSCYIGVGAHNDNNDYVSQQKIIHDCSPSIPFIFAHTVAFLEKKDKDIYDVYTRIQNTTDIDAIPSYESYSFEQAYNNDILKDFPNASAETEKVAQGCSYDFTFGTWRFPVLKDIQDPIKEFDRKVMEGMKKKGIHTDSKVKKRVEYESNIIKEKGFAVYFLILEDIMHYAHTHNILATTRGSAAGSIVAFILGITTINPIEYELPFERFLNPLRPKAPDIDIDIDAQRRQDILNYIRKKYGDDKVAQIGTFGKLLARAVVRDVARAYGYSYSVGDRIAKLIPFSLQSIGITLSDALQEVKELQELYDTDNATKKIVDTSKRIEGNVRHISIHAAGVVIAPKEITYYTPVQKDTKLEDKTITQYDMHNLEDAGLLKFDLLGLSNLTSISEAVEKIKNVHDKNFDIEKIPLDDKKTFQHITQGHTAGIFQMGGSGMTNFLRQLQPQSIHDINAMVALYRPGPMETIPQYIKRKNNVEKIDYLHPSMESFLEKSYGLLVYQDDVLFTAITLAGYDWGTVDAFRKAIGKKDAKVMAAQENNFITGCQKHGGCTEVLAKKLWELFEPFKRYGFNKAHAACYGRVAYQTAYLKTHYPTEFLSALLTTSYGNTDDIAKFFKEVQRMNIPIIPPSVSSSKHDFFIINKNKVPTIVYGFSGIKNLGNHIIQATIKEREEKPFKHLGDYISRIAYANLNKGSLEALIYSGCLDEFSDRSTLTHNLQNILNFAKETKHVPTVGTLFDVAEIPDIALSQPEASIPPLQLLWHEKKTTGTYISGHPMDSYSTQGYDTPTNISTMQAKSKVEVIGNISVCKRMMTRNKKPMAILTLEDQQTSVECVCFDERVQQYLSLFTPMRTVVIKGEVAERNGDKTIFINSMKEITN